MRVLKWTVPVSDEPTMIGGGQALHVACQESGDAVQVWTLEEDDPQDRLDRPVQVFATGQPLPENVGHHIGSALSPGGFMLAPGTLVWHLFEVIP